MSRRTYLFAGGGTGGHLFPGIAVAAELRKLDPDAEIHFFTTDRPLDRDLLAPTDHVQVRQPIRPVPSNPLAWPAFWFVWRASVRLAREFIRQRRPVAALGLGGYAAGPAVATAFSLGVRTAILNPDAVPGRANRYLASRTHLICLQWEASRAHFPSGAPCRALGCPIRSEFNELHVARRGDEPGQVPPRVQDARRAFGLAPDRLTLLATGASQGARTLNRALTAVWPEFIARDPRWQLLHLTGSGEHEDVRARYASQGVRCEPGSDDGAGRVAPIAFTHDMARAIDAADVVISRAGASTLAELSALGRPSILLPYPYHKDRHQHANADALVRGGAAILVEDLKDESLNAGPLLSALLALSDDATRETMAAAALRLGRPRAAHEMAQWLMSGA